MQGSGKVSTGILVQAVVNAMYDPEKGWSPKIERDLQVSWMCIFTWNFIGLLFIITLELLGITDLSTKLPPVGFWVIFAVVLALGWTYGTLVERHFLKNQELIQKIAADLRSRMPYGNQGFVGIVLVVAMVQLGLGYLFWG